jgi:hypothetical protein
VRDESLEYYRQRARAECEAAFNASCATARRAHAELAQAFERLAEIAELEQQGALPPGKVITITDALRERDHVECGGHAPKAPAPRQ